MWSGGTYKEIIPMKKIVATDHFADEKGNVVSPKDFGMPGEWPDEEMLVTVTFEDAGEGKTKLTITYPKPESEAAVRAMISSGMEMGWNSSLDKLASLLQL